jgi:mannose-1-phosphate guanylyltransferase
VVLTPSDHGVGDGTAFVQGLSDAIRHVRSSGGIVLLGVEPSSASEDFGWITLHPEAREARARLIRPVAGFVEKPHASVARRLLASGAIWNTMVLVAQARDLLTLSAAHLPEITAMFVRAADIARDEHPGFFRGVYSVLPRADFSRHVLAPARDLLAYTWPASMGWSDLGTPERLGAWLTAGPNGSTVGSRMVGGGARPDSAATAVAT